jgi:hypothetical protein
MCVGQLMLQSRDIRSICDSICFSFGLFYKHPVLGLCVSAGGGCVVRTLIRTCVCGWVGYLLARTEQTYYSSSVM